MAKKERIVTAEELQEDAKKTTSNIQGMTTSEEILKRVQYVLDGVQKTTPLKRAFPDLPYKGVKASEPSEIIQRMYLESLPKEDISHLMNLDILSNDIFGDRKPNIDDKVFLRIANVKGGEDIKAYYQEEKTRLLEKGKAIYTEKVEKAPETAIKDAAEVIDDITKIELVYYRFQVLDIKAEKDGYKAIEETAQAYTQDLFKLWLRVTKQEETETTKKEWIKKFRAIIDKKALEWEFETEQEQEERKKREGEPVHRKPELVTRPTSLKVPTSLLFNKLKEINSNFLKAEADGQEFMLVTDYFDKWGYGCTLEVGEVGTVKNKVPVVSYAAIKPITGEKLSERLRKITEFDIDVLSAVGTLTLLGNMKITPEHISQTMTGATTSSKQNKADNVRLKPQMKEKILLSLEKWRARILYLDFEEEIQQGLIKPQKKNLTEEDKEIISRKHFELTMLSYDLGTYTTSRGTEETEIIVHTLPVVYRYSGWKNQIAEIKSELLALPYEKAADGAKGIYATEDNITITNYLAKRIERMKSWQRDAEELEKRLARREKRQADFSKDLIEERRRTIRLDSLFSECDIDITNPKVKQRKIADIDEQILKKWKVKKYITDYQIKAEGQSHKVTKIIIFLKKPTKATEKKEKQKK